MLHSLFFMQMVSICKSYDIELEGAIHFGNDFMSRLGSDLLPLKPRTHEGFLQKSPFQLMAAESNEPVPLNDKQELASEKLNNVNKVTKKYGIPKMVDAKQMMKSTDFEAKTSNKKLDDKFRINLKNHLARRGCLRLKTLVHYINNTANHNIDVTPILRTATKDYLNAVTEYYEFIIKIPIKYDVDREFVVLDMLESTNKILINEAKKILDTFVKITSAEKISINMPMLMKTIETTILEEKGEQYKYICDTFDVCKPFPGYSDRLADLLSVLLQLTDSKFKDIITQIYEPIKEKRNFFKKIIRNDIYNKTSSRLAKSINNIAYMREVVSMLRAVITQRNKIFNSKSLVLKVRTKAVRLLLDLIDRAFDINDDVINSIEIDNTLKSYKQWASGKRNDVSLITKKFIYNAIEILNYNWGRETKEEVKVLTDIIFTGKTENIEVYKYLFTKGPVMFRDEDRRTNIGY